MQYYEEYNITKYDDIGILNKIEDDFYVNNKIVKNNRGIINDIVYILDNKIIDIKERNKTNIVGILRIDSKIKYGSIKDKLLYLFKPTDKKYPDFYVPYKKTSLLNIYVIIQFKKWDIYDKLPIGTLIENIGTVGNKEVEYEHLRNYYNIKNNIWKVSNDKKIENMTTLNNLELIEEDYKVFSIDPIGSKDIDDAFHFVTLENGNYEVGIHIASPTKFFKDNLKDILNRVSTVYTPTRKYNMLPNIYSDELISLLENKKRYALSLIIIFDNNFNIISENIKETIVKNIKNFNYDEFDKVFKDVKNLEEFVLFSNKFFKENKDDSHKLVENWMIYTNKYVANYLIKKNLSNIILRKHDYFDFYLDNNLDNDLIKHLKNINQNSAYYEIYDKELNQKHYEMGNSYYTHMTSPIRRSVDFLIHLLIIENKDVLLKEELNKYINHINIFTKNTRKFDRNTKRLEFLYNTKNLDSHIETYCYIISISINKITVFIPEYNLEEKIIIIPYKFNNIANVKLDKNDDTINKIEFIIDNIDKSYSLYQKLNIKLWIFMSFENIFDKLKIEILN